MQRKFLTFAAASAVSVALATSTLAIEPSASAATPESIFVQFGNGGHVVVPPKVELARGAAYELVFTNPSNETHYLRPDLLSGAVKSSSLVVEGGEYHSVSTLWPRGANPLGSSIGRIEEIELRAGGKVTWQFTAMVPGTYTVECGIPAHAAAGMKAVVVVR